jgi:hypothetical protein
MTPVALGDLPSQQPAPTGLVQFKRGAANAQTICPGNNSIMYDGAGSPMRISLTTGSRPGWWIIRAENIFLLADATWYWFAWYILVEPSDLDGYGNQMAHGRLHSALSWNQSCLDAAYRLNANTAYQCTMYFRDRQAGSFYYWTGPDYCTLSGEFIAEGSL